MPPLRMFDRFKIRCKTHIVKYRNGFFPDRNAGPGRKANSFMLKTHRFLKYFHTLLFEIHASRDYIICEKQSANGGWQS